MNFSIAIPVRGQSRFLPTALASVAAQSATVQLAVMDATPDDSVQKVLERHSHRPYYSRHAPDDGQSAAIQEGWDRTTGDIVGWLCADDYLFPNALTAVEAIFREQPDVDVVYGDGIFSDRDNRFIRYFPSISEDVTRITKDCCISQPSCFVRRTAMQHVGGVRKDLHYVMDWDLWTRLYLAGHRFHYLRRPLSASRIYPGTKTTSDSAARATEMWRHLATYNRPHEILRSLIGIRLSPLIYRELDAGTQTALKRAAQQVTLFLRQLRRPRFRHSITMLYGLEIGTNAVKARCRIHLPFFEDSPPRRFHVDTVEDVELTASVDGIDLTATPRGATGRHSFEIPSDLFRKSFEFEVQCPMAKRWHLFSAHIE